MIKRLLFTPFFFLFFVQTIYSQIKYTEADGNWDADSLGNQRAVVDFRGPGKYAFVIINWRRRDSNPQNVKIIVQDAKTLQNVSHVKPLEINREFGKIVFEPSSGIGRYYIYYLPYRNEGRSNYPRGVYLKADINGSGNWMTFPKGPEFKQNAFCNEIQSIDSFDRVYPMEVIATEKETKLLQNKFRSEQFLVFPEDRIYPIRMKTDLPLRWIQKGPSAIFQGDADKGENYAFQLGIYALSQIQDLWVAFSELTGPENIKIPVTDISCINTEGINYDGKSIKFHVDISAFTVQPLWFTLKTPSSIPAGIYRGHLKIGDGAGKMKSVTLSIHVHNNLAEDGGVNKPEHMTRLNWLNSTMAQENTVIAPYTPLKSDGNIISLLGRKLEINEDGLPRQIQTFFTEEMTGYGAVPNNELAEPIHFHFLNRDGKEMQWKHSGLKFSGKEQGTIQWQVVNMNDSLLMEVSASLEFDGFLSYKVKITALKDVEFKDISMLIPFRREAAKYMMGLGQKGGKRPETIDWKWDVANRNQDGAWIGAVNAGLQYSLRDEKYSRPLNTNFYLQKPLLLPSSWGNENKGGISIREIGETVVASNYSGSRIMRRDDVLYYNFNLLITPFHPINTDFQWETRFYHRYNNLDSIKAEGATVVNIHHATAINPWINYPFIEWKKMKAYIDSAHSMGLKVKIYNTIRELSDHAYETFALRSLGHEVYSAGKGGGFSWLQEHLCSDYIAAWFVPELKDAAIVNSGMNRWHNYYVEGMNWLVRKVGIDGIYLDDVAFDRVTMKRIKRVLTSDNHPGIIDLHSANQYNKSDGFNNSAMLYMEHFPYLNRLWFGEYFDYEKNSPDFFLTEVSGIPFGLMGEMLQGDGNPWRGMLYGMTNRLGWSDKSDPRPIWDLWNQAGMQGMEMLGYWSSNCPVKTNNDKVLATVYRKKDIALISIASWCDTTAMVQLQINWKDLGMDEGKAMINAPAVKNFQPAKTFLKNDLIPVEKGKGWLLVIKEK
jgi:hypothetical protein